MRRLLQNHIRTLKFKIQKLSAASKHVTLFLFLGCLSVIVFSSCEDALTQAEEPTTGVLKITTETSGEDMDSDGYTVEFGDREESVSANESVIFDNIDPGDFRVELFGVNSNCEVESSATEVNVALGDTAFVDFYVTCINRAENEIVFHNSDLGKSQIYIINADGSNERKLTNDEYTNRYAVFSNDATKIAFSSDRNEDGHFNIFIMNIEGNNVQQVTNTAISSMTPEWSPDDSTLVYEEEEEIYTIKIDGSSRTRLTNNSSPEWQPAWSPDGKKIAFSSKRDGNTDLYIMNSDGTQQEYLLNDDYDSVQPSWSPDGDHIAFKSKISDQVEDSYIFTITADGNERSRVSGNKASQPTWSPDGSQIAFESFKENPYADIFKTPSDEVGNAQKVSEAEERVDNAPDWSPIKE